MLLVKKMNKSVIAHSSFIGETGYNYFSRNFFMNLHKKIPVSIKSYSYSSDIAILSEEEKELLNRPREEKNNTNIIFDVTNHDYFFRDYSRPKIAYNIWESTRQPENFFKKLLEFDQFWCPSEWQRKCIIEQGYPFKRVRVVPGGVSKEFYPNVDSNLLSELCKKYLIEKDKFYFLLFGRWDYRKSTTEIFKAFFEEFRNDKDVILIASVDNSFPLDGFKGTRDRLKKNNIDASYYNQNLKILRDVTNKKIRVISFIPRQDYINWLRAGHVFVSCSRSEGWNLPLIESIASGTPSICSNWGAQLDFAKDISGLVNIKELRKPEKTFYENDDLGFWAEPDFEHLKSVMREMYSNYSFYKERAILTSTIVSDIFSWENSANIAYKEILEIKNE